MISEKVFDQQMKEFQALLGVEAKPEYLLALYKHLANEFSDAEFMEVSHKVLTEEELYGRMPTVRHFTKYLPKKITDDEFREAKKQAFLEKVSDYLQLDYVMDYDRQKFNNISELESRALRANGGLSEMYQRVHSYDYPCKISTIIKELSDFYDANYTRESVEQRQQIERRGGGFKQLGDCFGFLKNLEDA
jgi:hypothetical protein